MAYSLQLWIDAHTAARTRILGGASASTVKIKSAGGTTLAEATIDETNSEIDSGTGNLQFAIDVQEDDATAGTAAFAQLCDGDGAVHVELPCVAGTSLTPGYAVLNTLNILDGSLVDVLLVQIAPPAGSVL